jgi:hypothetical protein
MMARGEGIIPPPLALYISRVYTPIIGWNTGHRTITSTEDSPMFVVQTKRGNRWYDFVVYVRWPSAERMNAKRSAEGYESRVVNVADDYRNGTNVQ